MNMANNAFMKLPEFWDFSQTVWFAQTEARFAIRDVTDDTARYYQVVSALGRSTATRAASFIANPPSQGKSRDLKAFLLKTFEPHSQSGPNACWLFEASGTAYPPSIWRLCSTCWVRRSLTPT